VDVCVSVEVNHDTYYLAAALLCCENSVPMSEKPKIIGGLSWLFQKYIQATACDGVLSTNVLHREACMAIYMSSSWDDRVKMWGLEGSDNLLLTRKDTLAYQSFWLFTLYNIPRYRDVFKIPRAFCRTYAGDFHYRLPLDVGGRTIETSPMELALDSFTVLGRFIKFSWRLEAT
jgi:hypothetical protein